MLKNIKKKVRSEGVRFVILTILGIMTVIFHVKMNGLQGVIEEEETTDRGMRNTDCKVVC